MMGKKLCNSFNLCSEKKEIFLVKGAHEITNCTTCNHRQTIITNTNNHLKEIYGDDYFFEGKQGYPNYLLQKDMLLKYGINYAKILSKYMEPGRVLDVGCAAGFILKGFETAGWKGTGLEPNDTMAAYGRDKQQLDITTGNLESFSSDTKFDLISLIQVIGHFIDLDKAIINAKELLVDDGHLLVESWDMDSTLAKLMGKHWHEYSPPSVINWFNDTTIKGLFEYYGFTLVAKGRPPKKISIKHGLSLFEESTPNFIFKKGVLKFLNRTMGKYTVNYPPLDLKWYLFKKIN